MSETRTVHLGFEVGSGEAVAVPLKHLAVTGQTQESGKTTTLEALVSRAGTPALAFVTKRGEGNFAGGRRLAPYFRDRADWQFVDQLLEAQLREKNKFLRPWIIKLCRSTKTLADVQAAVKKGLVKAKGLSEGVYTQLDAYLDLIVPEIARAPLAAGVDLSPGLNVMDVSGYQTPMQMLFVQSAIDWVNAHGQGVVTIVPEAWEFIPESKGSPVKASAVALVRKGAALGNFIWVDSQDMAGVSKEILRGCTVWLVGAQREANEIKRNLANIPADMDKPRAADIARLERGQFFACWKGTVKKVYVQPAWMPADEARGVARGERKPLLRVPDYAKRIPQPGPDTSGTATADDFARLPPEIRAEREKVIPVAQKNHRERWLLGDGGTLDDALTKPTPEREDLDMADVKRLEEKLDRVLAALAAQPAPNAVAIPAADPVPVAPDPAASVLTEELWRQIKARMLKEIPADLAVHLKRPEVVVKVERQVIEVNGDSLRGRLARLLKDGFFDKDVTGGLVQKELARRGYNVSPGSLYPELDALAAMGFLTIEPPKEKKGAKFFKAVGEMKGSVKGG